MNSEEVCLRWNNFSSNITKNIDDLWKDESLVDATICSEGKSIQAHKIILSASSPLFKGIFAVNPCQHPVVILQDVKYRELSAIIAFIYKGEVNIDQQYLPELLQAAHTLQIRGLSDSVGTDNNDESPKPQQSAKKRKVQSNENEQREETFQQEPVLIPKEEYPFPKEEVDTNEFIPPDIETRMSDEDDVKDIRLDCNIGENSQMLVAPSENHDSAWVNVCTEGSQSNYLCPFCKRSYTCWGYRRRHIKACHAKIEEISCRWCPKNYFTQEVWIQHITNHHNLPLFDAQQGIDILDEAIKVLHLRTDRPDLRSILGT